MGLCCDHVLLPFLPLFSPRVEEEASNNKKLAAERAAVENKIKGLEEKITISEDNVAKVCSRTTAVASLHGCPTSPTGSSPSLLTTVYHPFFLLLPLLLPPPPPPSLPSSLLLLLQLSRDKKVLEDKLQETQQSLEGEENKSKLEHRSRLKLESGVQDLEEKLGRENKVAPLLPFPSLPPSSLLPPPSLPPLFPLSSLLPPYLYPPPSSVVKTLRRRSASFSRR